MLQSAPLEASSSTWTFHAGLCPQMRVLTRKAQNLPTCPISPACGWRAGQDSERRPGVTGGQPTGSRRGDAQVLSWRLTAGTVFLSLSCTHPGSGVGWRSLGSSLSVQAGYAGPSAFSPPGQESLAQCHEADGQAQAAWQQGGWAGGRSWCSLALASSPQGEGASLARGQRVLLRILCLPELQRHLPCVLWAL